MQEFAVDSKVIVMSHSEITRKLHVWCIGPDRALKRSAFIIDELDILGDLGIGSIFSRDESFLPDASAMFELPSTTTDHYGSLFHLHHLGSEVTRECRLLDLHHGLIEMIHVRRHFSSTRSCLPFAITAFTGDEFF